MTLEKPNPYNGIRVVGWVENGEEGGGETSSPIAMPILLKSLFKLLLLWSRQTVAEESEDDTEALFMKPCFMWVAAHPLEDSDVEEGESPAEAVPECVALLAQLDANDEAALESGKRAALVLAFVRSFSPDFWFFIRVYIFSSLFFFRFAFRFRFTSKHICLYIDKIVSNFFCVRWSNIIHR